jgi:hypothetical protein
MFKRSIVDRLMLTAATAHCRRVLKRLNAALEDADQVQSRVLHEHIRRNANSAYGREFGFNQIKTLQDFRRQVPLQTYEDIRPYVDRLRKGEFDAMFGEGQRVLMFALTSGTANQPKYIPVTDRFLHDVKAGWNAFGIKALLDHPGNFLKPILQITSRMDESRTEAGIPCGAITGLMAATQKKLVRKYYITPPDIAHIENPHARYYTIMRLAVALRDVAFSVTANPATQLRLARTADRHANELIQDVHDGTLTSSIDLPDDVRATLQSRLVPDPVRAKELSRHRDKRGALLPRDYWQLGYLCNWTGGTLGLFLQDFEHYFGDVPIRDIGLIASEGRMTIPMNDGTPAGTLDVTSAFYEFIPADQIDAQQPDCVLSGELTPGDEYFMVLTNAAGLYRYNIGDRVRVHGYDRRAPILEFLSKGAHTSSLTGEKLTEHQVTAAMPAAAQRCGVRLSNYVFAPRFSSPPYYVLHLESAGTQQQLADLQAAVDQELASCNIEYAEKRRSARLGPPRVHTLPPGFLESRHHRLASRYRKGNEQYKHQFLLSTPDEDREFPNGRWLDESSAALEGPRQGPLPQQPPLTRSST